MIYKYYLYWHWASIVIENKILHLVCGISNENFILFVPELY